MHAPRAGRAWSILGLAASLALVAGGDGQASRPSPVLAAGAGQDAVIACHAERAPTTTTRGAATDREQPERTRLDTKALSTQRVTVDVYVHILRSKSSGGVSRSRVKWQIRHLNRAFAGRQSRLAARGPFHFRLVDVDVTVNRGWMRMDEGSVAEARAKHTLHRGDARDLNFYIGRNRSGSLGWGTQPTQADAAPKMDGVVVARHTMPGGSSGRYSSGDAAVHETGHWLGLLHTFAGKCGKRGDLVADTPREARPSYTCPIRRDTCTAPGRDPVHNFMDYSYDSCVNQFTPGQVARMRHSWAALRKAG